MDLNMYVALGVFALTALCGVINFAFVGYGKLETAGLSTHSLKRFIYWCAQRTTLLEHGMNYLFSLLPIPMLPVIAHEGSHNLISKLINVKASWHIRYTKIEEPVENLSDATLYIFFLAPWLILPVTMTLLVAGLHFTGWVAVLLFTTGVSMAYNTGPSFSDYSALQDSADNTALPDTIISLIDLPCFLHLFLTSILVGLAYGLTSLF